MTEIKNHKIELENRFRKFYAKQIILDISGVLANTLWRMAILFFLILIAEETFRFETLTRTVLWYALWLTGITLFLFFSIRKLILERHVFRGPDFAELAGIIGDCLPGIRDSLKNAYQLVAGSHKGESEALIEAAFEQVYLTAETLNFNEALETGYAKKAWSRNYITLFLLVIVFLYNPFGEAFTRICNYSQSYVVPPKYSFQIKPGNATYTKGNPLDISIKIFGGAAESIDFYYKSKEDFNFKNENLRVDSTGEYHFIKNSIQQSIKYFAYFEGVSSDTFEIKIVERPIVEEFTINLTPPRYTGLNPVMQRDNGDINVLPGTKYDIELKSSKHLSAARMVFADSSKIELNVDGNIAKGKFIVKEAGEYYFALKDTANISSVNPIIYSIDLTEDLPPSIELLLPKQDVTLGEVDLVPIIVKISDDYGFSKLKLNYKLTQSNFKQIDSVFKSINLTVKRNKTEQEVSYDWDLTDLALAENDIVSFYLEVWDNDYVSSPKSAKTKVISIRVPTLDELFKLADQKQEESVDDLRTTLEETKKLNEEIAKLRNELRKDDKKINWEEKAKIESSVEKMKALEKKINDVAEKIKKMQQELQKNNLLSEETLRKYEELQKLFDELTSEEMKKAMEQMNQLLSKMDRDKIQQQMEQMKFNEDAFQKSLERTINLLKRIQVEQKLDEVIKRTEDVLKKQEEINKQTQKQNNSDEEKKELAKKQEKLKNDLAGLKNEMQKLQSKMAELQDMPKDEMKELQEEFEKQKNEELAEKAKEKMENEDLNSAMQMQNQLMQNMKKMQKKLSAIKSQMQMQNQVKTMAEMLQITNELIDLSKEEEDLKNRTKGLSNESPQLTEIARKQNELISALNKIVGKMMELSQKTFAITPEMGKALGMARMEMSNAISSMQNRNSQMGIKGQSGAMKYLNEAAQQMQNSMANMMNPGKGGGMMSLMQQMQQMAQQQMSLNQMTKMMKNGKLSLEQMAQMQRLAQQQQQIQKTLEELNKELEKTGGKKKITGNLEKIIDEMKEVVNGLNTQKFDENLIHKQERILSRMLDAQRSINERDYEKNRESVTGKQFNLSSPGELNLNGEESINKLKDELLKALREGYSKDYEQLIRQYFKALQKELEK